MAFARNASHLHPEDAKSKMISYESFFFDADLYVYPSRPQTIYL